VAVVNAVPMTSALNVPRAMVSARRSGGLDPHREHSIRLGEDVEPEHALARVALAAEVAGHERARPRRRS